MNKECDFQTVGVIGAGVMGRGIAQVTATAGMQVIVVDLSQDVLDAALADVTGRLERLAEKGKLSPDGAAAALRRIEWVSAKDRLAACDLIIEAAPEKLDLKQALLNEVATILSDEAVLATNTSSLSVAEIGAGLSDPARFGGLHFFNPVPVMKLVEVVRTDVTSAQTIDRLTCFAAALGKIPVCCGDTPGFVVNRCARPFYGEALAILEEGLATPWQIDAACQAAGYRLGPFALIDLVGADVNLAATEGVAAKFNHHPRYHVFAALGAQVAAGRLGRKSGEGFVTPASDTPPAALDGDGAQRIVERIETVLVNEAASLAGSGAVSEADIDTAVRLGLNFPRGPFEIAHTVGRDVILGRLNTLEAAAPSHLSGRYVPVSYLSGRQLGTDPVQTAEEGHG